MLTLIAWGWIVDRIGERSSMTIGLALLTVASVAAALSTSYVGVGIFLLLGGMGGACTNSASGRVVVGWFPPHRRGTAMGIRQTASPLGVGLAVLIVPNLVDAQGLRTTLLVIAASIHRDPPAQRPQGSGTSSTPTHATCACGASTARRCCSSSRRSPCGRSPSCG